MSQVTKYVFYTIVIFQILLNVITLTNSAVIRRDQQSITINNNDTLSGISDREFEPATSIGLEDDENLLLETLESIKDDTTTTTTTKNSVQDTITTTTSSAFGEEDKKEDTTLTGLRLDENTVSLSSDDKIHQESSKVVIRDENESEISKNEESTTTKKLEDVTSKSSITKIIETTTLIPVIEIEKTTSKKEEKIEDVSTNLYETSTQQTVKSIDNTRDKTEREETTVETSEDTTRVISTLLEETTKINVSAMDTNKTTTATEVVTTIPVLTDSATKPTDLPTTNSKIEEEVGKLTEPVLVQKELIATSTEPSHNDISKTLINNKPHKENVIDENQLTTTTESILLTKHQHVGIPKPSDDTFTKSVVESTPLTPTTTEFPEENAIKLNSSSTEKRGKFIAHSSFNDFHLPNTSDVWALASLRSVGKAKSSEIQNSVETSEEKPLNNSVVTKSLHDWTRVMDTTNDNLEPKHFLRIVESTAKPTTDLVTSITTETSQGTEHSTTSKEMNISTETQKTTNSQDNEVDISTTKPETESFSTTKVETKPISTRKVESEPNSTTEVETETISTEKVETEPISTVKVESEPNSTTKVETEPISRAKVEEEPISTVRVETEPTTVISLGDKIERKQISNPTESQNTSSDFDITTVNYEMHDKTITTNENPPKKDSDDILSTTVISLLDDTLTNHEKTIEENKVDSDSFEKENKAFPTTTTTATTTTTTVPTLIPQIVTVKSETTESLLVNGEITRETNAATNSLSISSLSDFTTSIPFLTATTATAITKATMEVMTDMMTTTPPVIINSEYEVNELPSSTVASKILTQQTSSPVAVTMGSSPVTSTTTTTTMPAVTVVAAITETQTTTTEAPHTTPAIIGNNETMIQKSNNNNNYNEYEVVNKSTENYADNQNSSTEAFEPTTRVGLQSDWSTNAAAKEISTTEVDKLNDELDVTTISNFENNSNNANGIESTTSAVINTVTLAPKTYPIVTDTASVDSGNTSTENLDHIDPINKISETAEASIESNVIDPLQVGETTSTTTAATTTTTITTTTESNQENMKMPTTERGDDEDIFSISSTTTTTTTTTSTPNYDESLSTTFESISTKKEDVYSIVPTIDIGGGGGGFHIPKSVLDDTTTLMPPGEIGIGIGGDGDGGGLQPMDSPEAQETDVNVIIAISVSTVGIIALILLVAFLYVMRKRQKQMSYGQRCRPVSLDAYSLDNVSVYNSVRRKGATLRASKRSYGNVAFDDPSLRHNVLGTHELARYVEKKSSIWEEFKEVPQIIARADEVPAGCEDKNRYANVIPLPETRVILQQQNGDEKSEYINANYVRGPKDTTNYYIACQAPLETTVNDFWRMIWEQNSRVIIMATDLIENGIDKCAEYLPPSVTLDNHTVFGDYQVTLKHREVKEKYAISTLMLKNTVNDESREITHYWYQWPETGVPTDEAAIIAMLLEARSSLKAYTIEQSDNKIENSTVEDNSSVKSEINGNVTSEKPKSPATKEQGPLTIHCSPGTGRTGTILACDVAMRCLEEPKRTVDIPQIVYSVRRGRASAVQTKEQYEFIYKVTHMYATKISNINNDN